MNPGLKYLTGVWQSGRLRESVEEFRSSPQKAREEWGRTYQWIREEENDPAVDILIDAVDFITKEAENGNCCLYGYDMHALYWDRYKEIAKRDSVFDDEEDDCGGRAGSCRRNIKTRL